MRVCLCVFFVDGKDGARERGKERGEGRETNNNQTSCLDQDIIDVEAMSVHSDHCDLCPHAQHIPPPDRSAR